MLRYVYYMCGALMAAVVVFYSLEMTYRYYDLKNHLAETLKTADLETDSEIRKKVVGRAKRSGVQCIEQDIVVTRGAGHVVVDMPYKHEVQLTVLGHRYTLLLVALNAKVERYF
jgi:hypothetical protein